MTRQGEYMRIRIGQLVVGFGEWIGGGTKSANAKELGLEPAPPPCSADYCGRRRPSHRGRPFSGLSLSNTPPPASAPAHPDPQQQIRQLIKQALEAPTAQQEPIASAVR
jgi:hypothetical protein